MFAGKFFNLQKQDGQGSDRQLSNRQTGERLRLQLWLLSFGMSSGVWAVVLMLLFRFISGGLALSESEAELVRDRFLLSFGLTMPLLGVLAYVVILFVAGQQQETAELRQRLARLLADVQQPVSDPSVSQATDARAQPLALSAELQNNLVAMLSQAYRTPLTAILSSSELIERYGETWDKTRIDRHLQRIGASVETMTELLNDTLLLVGRSETGPLQFEPVLLDFNSFVQDFVENSGTFADLSRIHLQPLPEAVSVEGDPRLVRSLLKALLSNALKFSPVDRSVDLTLSYEADRATLTIRDQGNGIPESEQEKVFEPFYRGEAAQSVPGSGLGLAIARICAALHGGEIAIITSANCEAEESEAEADPMNLGTAIVVTLPMPHSS